MRYLKNNNNNSKKIRLSFTICISINAYVTNHDSYNNMSNKLVKKKKSLK